MSELRTMTLVKLKKALQAVPVEKREFVLNEFYRLTSAIDMQHKALNAVKKDFHELYAVLIQLAQQNNGELRIETRNLTKDLFSLYRLERNRDEKTGEIVLKLKHMIDK